MCAGRDTRVVDMHGMHSLTLSMGTAPVMLSMCIWLGVNVALLACHLIGLVGPPAGLQLGEEVEVRGEQRVLGGSHTHTPTPPRGRGG
jgi:hypothetical protein